MVKRPWGLTHRLPYVVPLLAALVLLAGGSALAQADAGAAGWSASDCATCHDKAVGAAFAASKHAKLDQSCHDGGHETQPRAAEQDANHHACNDHGHEALACQLCFQRGEPETIVA